MRVHSWCCRFHGFGQMYNDMYSSLWYHTEYFHHPKNLSCATNSSLPLHPPLATTDLFTVSVVLPLPEVGLIQDMAFSDWLLSLSLLFNLLVFTVKVPLLWTSYNWVFVIGYILQKQTLNWSLLCRVFTGVSNCGSRGGE